MKLTIEIDIKDGDWELNESVASVKFSDNWEKFTPEECAYYIKLLKIDLDEANKIFQGNPA